MFFRCCSRRLRRLGTACIAAATLTATAPNAAAAAAAAAHPPAPPPSAAASAFVRGIAIKPYGVLGVQMTTRGKFLPTGPEPTAADVVVRGEGKR
jgi:hypothetical protein